MTTINLVSEYGYRNIEGIDKQDLFEAFNGTSSIFKIIGDKRIIYIPSGQEIQLDCVCKYFDTIKPYYRIKDIDGCNFKQKALGINNYKISSCNQCFQECILHNQNVKRNKVAYNKKIIS